MPCDFRMPQSNSKKKGAHVHIQRIGWLVKKDECECPRNFINKIEIVVSFTRTLHSSLFTMVRSQRSSASVQIEEFLFPFIYSVTVVAVAVCRLPLPIHCNTECLMWVTFKTRIYYKQHRPVSFLASKFVGICARAFSTVCLVLSFVR